MLVTEGNFSEVMSQLKKQKLLFIDTETTGLRPYHGDMLFSIIIGDLKNEYYFNFNQYEDVQPLEDSYLKELRDNLFSTDIHWVIHNAKFDMAMLARDGIEISGTVTDTWSLGRLEYNDHFSYSLDNMVKRVGGEKSDAVEEYIKEHKLWEYKSIPGTTRRSKDKFYNQVPFDVIYEYGLQDVRALRQVYLKGIDALRTQQLSSGHNIPSPFNILAIESKLTTTLFNMERRGVQCDISYCNEAESHYTKRIKEIVAEFKATTGHEFSKGSNLFKEIFKDEKWVMTPKGNPRFDADTLKTFNHPAAKLVVEYAHAKKNLEYFQNFKYQADPEGVIHTNFKQAGTATGRLSSSDPNLQNLTKDSGDSAYPVRRAFVPRDGYFFAMLDMDQMEYRMMLDMAKAHGLIDKVLGGLDVHQATADAAGITRTEAKTVNFSVLYGSGLASLGQNLGVSKAKARDIRDSIFRAAPEVRSFIYSVQSVSEKRGYIRNWAGRRSFFDNKTFCYKAPNYLIQGGCADVIKEAMNRCFDYLKDKKSHMILTIHDELVFEIALDEQYILEELKEIMENVYPSKRLALTCGIEISHRSLADKQEWTGVDSYHGKETRNHIQGQSTANFRVTPQHLD